MRVGLFMGATGWSGTLDEQIEQVVAAERDGFDSFWFAQTAGPDVLTLIALAGQRTSRIELGTAVVPTMTRHPNVLAQQASTVQAAIGGRLTLGVGVSHRPGVEDRLGLSFDRPALHMREYLSVLRPLAQESKVEYHGRVFNVTAAFQVAGTRPYPILVAALAPMMLRVAGELAEGTITWMVGPKTLTTHIVPRITAAAERAGRSAPRICAGVPVAVCDDRSAGHAAAGRLFAGYGQLLNYRRMLDIEGVDGPADMAIVGDEESVAGQLQALGEAGATDLLAVVFPVGDDAAASTARTTALLRRLAARAR